MPQIDWTLHANDLLMFGALIIAGGKILLQQRDFNRDVLTILRGANGTNGLVSDVKGLKHEVYESGGRLSKFGHYLSSIRTCLATQNIKTPDPE